MLLEILDGGPETCWLGGKISKDIFIQLQTFKTTLGHSVCREQVRGIHPRSYRQRWGLQKSLYGWTDGAWSSALMIWVCCGCRRAEMVAENAVCQRLVSLATLRRHVGLQASQWFACDCHGTVSLVDNFINAGLARPKERPNKNLATPNGLMWRHGINDGYMGESSSNGITFFPEQS